MLGKVQIILKTCWTHFLHVSRCFQCLRNGEISTRNDSQQERGRALNTWSSQYQVFPYFPCSTTFLFVLIKKHQRCIPELLPWSTLNNTTFVSVILKRPSHQIWSSWKWYDLKGHSYDIVLLDVKMFSYSCNNFLINLWSCYATQTIWSQIHWSHRNSISTTRN